jgi:hypothetical protein
MDKNLMLTEGLDISSTTSTTLLIQILYSLKMSDV